MAPIPGISGGIGGRAGGGSLIYVGGTSGTGAASAVTVSLSGTLTGGISSGLSPIANDFVVVAVCQGATSDTNVGVTGYTELFELYSNDSVDTNFGVFYKRMTSTPDTSITATSSAYSSTHGIAVAVHVWRNVNGASPFDVTSTTATGVNTCIANPPSITPVTPGSQVLVIGASGYDGFAGNVVFTHSEATNLVRTSTSPGAGGAGIAIGSYAFTSGSYDPVAFGLLIPGPDTNNASWGAASVVLRP